MRKGIRNSLILTAALYIVVGLVLMVFPGSALVLSLFGALMVFNPFKAMSTLVLVIGLGLVFDGANTLAGALIANQVYRDR